MRVTSNEEGEGGKAMVMATKVAGKRLVVATKRVMAMKMRGVGEEEGNGKGSKSNSMARKRVMAR